VIGPGVLAVEAFCASTPGAPRPPAEAHQQGSSEQKISRVALDDQAQPARRAVDTARAEDVLRPLLVRGGRIKLPGTGDVETATASGRAALETLADDEACSLPEEQFAYYRAVAGGPEDRVSGAPVPFIHIARYAAKVCGCL
jgi:hypothetical protein